MKFGVQNSAGNSKMFVSLNRNTLRTNGEVA